MIIKNSGRFKKGCIPWNKGTKGIIKFNKTSFKKGQIPWIKGKHFSEESKKKMSESRKKLFEDGYICPRDTKGKIWKTRRERYGEKGTKNLKETKRKISETKKRLYVEGKLKSWNKGIKLPYEVWNKIDGNAKKRIRKIVKRKPLSNIIWCNYYGIPRIPEGCVIHHINQDTEDNRIENLQLMDRRFHSQLHNEYFKLMKGEIIV